MCAPSRDYARIVRRVDGAQSVVMVCEGHNGCAPVNLRILSLKEVTAEDYIVFCREDPGSDPSRPVADFD